MTTARKSAASSQAAKTPAKVVEESIATAKETVETTLKQAQDVSTKNVEDVISLSKEQVDKTLENASKSFDEAVSFATANAEASAKSYSVVSKGGEAMARKLMDLSKASVENQYAIARKLMTVTSVTQLMEIASDHAKASYDTMVSESTSMTEMMVKITNDAAAPLSERMHATMELVGKPIAA